MIHEKTFKKGERPESRNSISTLLDRSENNQISTVSNLSDCLSIFDDLDDGNFPQKISTAKLIWDEIDSAEEGSIWAEISTIPSLILDTANFEGI